MYYPVTIPRVIKKWIYPEYIWEMSDTDKEVYLTFDDGPHPVVTPFVLDELKKYQAKATFFCIGNNVAKYPDVYKRILDEGHAIGNHTHDHLNGWNTDNDRYFKNIAEASRLIDSSLFRPPYGRITRFQARYLKEKWQFKIIMWSVLSGDFDAALSPQQCLNNVIKNTRAGSIIVFHDSEKAYRLLQHVLPESLDKLKAKGYFFDKLKDENC